MKPFRAPPVSRSPLPPGLQSRSSLGSLEVPQVTLPWRSRRRRSPQLSKIDMLTIVRNFSNVFFLYNYICSHSRKCSGFQAYQMVKTCSKPQYICYSHKISSFQMCVGIGIVQFFFLLVEHGRLPNSGHFDGTSSRGSPSGASSKYPGRNQAVI